MANIGFSRNERGYVQLESTFGVVPNTTGTATLSGANAFRFKKLTLTPAVESLTREDKTGSRSLTPGSAGKRSATWDLNASLVTNGVAGVLADNDPIMQCLMGSAGTINSGTASITGATNATPIVCTATNTFAAGDVVTISGATGACAAGPNGAGLNGTFVIVGVSGAGFTLLGSSGSGSFAGTVIASRVNVVYRLSDAISTMSLWSFRTPTTLAQRVASGCAVKQAKFTLNQKIAEYTASGPAKWVLNNKEVTDASEDANALSGLTTFPAEPGSPVTNGGIIPGYQGRFVIGGVSWVRLNSLDLAIDTGNDLPVEYFTTQYPQSPEGDTRKVTASFSVDDDDSAAMQTLYEAARDYVPIDAVVQIGNVPGNTILAYIKSVQLPMPSLDDSTRRWQSKFGEAMAHGSSLTALDDIAIWFC